MSIALESYSNPQKIRQVFMSAMKKKFLILVSGFLLSDPLWPTSSGPRPKPLDGSILLKFLLETRLKSESFDTLINLLGFLVQKL